MSESVCVCVSCMCMFVLLAHTLAIFISGSEGAGSHARKSLWGGAAEKATCQPPGPESGFGPIARKQLNPSI